MVQSVLVRRVGTLLAFAVAAMAPFIHLAAFRKLVRVSKTSNLSLALEAEEFQHALETVDANTKWRWRTVWREPRRIGVTIRNWGGDMIYGLLLSGSVQDKLLRESSRRRRNRVTETSVLRRVSQELARSKPKQAPDRSLWKAQAMDRMKEKHAKDYARKKYDVSGFVAHISVKTTTKTLPSLFHKLRIRLE
jgi:hypothetical protein